MCSEQLRTEDIYVPHSQIERTIHVHFSEVKSYVIDFVFSYIRDSNLIYRIYLKK